MNNKHIASEINQTIEDIWMILEQKERAYTNFKLNNQQYILLTLIIRHPSSTTTDLAGRMDITKSAVSQQLAKLESKNFIERKQHTDDKRTYTIELADKGLQYKKEMESFNRDISEKYNGHLTPDELTNMLSTLQKLRHLLE